jgi:anti-sigma-K factor RskA
MATSDQEQQSINVPQHKRLAQGAKLDGTSLQPKGGNAPAKPTGGLGHLKKSK